jgi:hypothetical protein
MSYKYTKLHFHYHDLKKKSFLPNLCNKKAFKIYLFLFQNYHFSKKSSEFQFLIKKSLYFIIKATKHPSWIVKLFTILSSVYDIMSMVTYIGPFKKYSQTASSEDTVFYSFIYLTWRQSVQKGIFPLSWCWDNQLGCFANM